MKKFVLFIAMIALFTQNIDSKIVTVDQAKTIAKQFAVNPGKFTASNVDVRLNYVANNM